MQKILTVIVFLSGFFFYHNAEAVECDYGVKLADTCPEGMTFIGCCDGAKLIWCGNKESDTGPLCGINCANNTTPEAQVCGWSADAGFYDCGGSGANPADPGSINCAWTCTPSCSDKECGDDGCLGTCGTCGEGKFCNEGKCQDCSCQGKVCGADECGNPCGGPCEAGKGCLNGQCVPIPDHCIEKETKGCPGCPCETCTCQEDPWCCPDSSQGNWDSFCILECVELCGGDPCPCAGDCEGKECGGDGCGGTCGTCSNPNAVCTSEGKCCVPNCAGKECGTDGCGGQCGECQKNEYCDENGQCQVCSCGDKNCGYDQCGNSCGKCGEKEYCDETGHCQACSCAGKECGDDGCGLPCGTCTGGKGCLNGKCVDVPPSCLITYQPGCNACACEDCVCNGNGSDWEGDPYCCDPKYGWDYYCALECHEYCGGPECPCVPECEGKECGSDMCGGACGTCAAGNYCNTDGKCVACTCEGRECGEDGCGNKCGPLNGACPTGKVCDISGKCVDDPCKGITYEGCCDGTILKYCYGGSIKTIDCSNNGCGWVDKYYDCGGSGEDPSGQNPITCPACTPDCAGKECGPDGCGGLCGTCGEGLFCGSDGKCGGGYPSVCLGEEQPSAATCTVTSTFEGCCDAQNRVVWCDGGQLYCLDCTELEATCGWDNQKKFYLCGGSDTPPPEFPMECMTTCTPNCNGAECGDGGCPDMPDACGKCEDGKVCVDGKCTSCTPNCTGKQCGDDGCGGSCGTCPNGKVCVEGLCEEPCTPNCLGKECGSDGCKGVCGTCAAGKTCNAEGKCVDVCVANCKDKECGDDGCGGSCGTCPSGKKCEAGICVTTVDGPVVQDVPVTDKPGTDVVVVIDSGTDGTGGGGGGSGCNTGVGGQALPFALLLSSLGLALLRRR